jgi:biopolymer transport protein ExbB
MGIANEMHWNTLIQEGGPIMIPLLLCSLVVWMVILERFWSLYKFKKELSLLNIKAQELLDAGKINEVKGLFTGAHWSIGAPLLAMVMQKEKGEDFNRHQSPVDRRLSETQMSLKRFLWILGTVSTMAPFIGLFGTIVGIIKSFDSMAQSGKGGFSVVASGLSEALIATAAGILVAIISSIFYNYFQVQVSKIALEFKNDLLDLSDQFNFNSRS